MAGKRSCVNVINYNEHCCLSIKINRSLYRMATLAKTSVNLTLTKENISFNILIVTLVFVTVTSMCNVVRLSVIIDEFQLKKRTKIAL